MMSHLDAFAQLPCLTHTLQHGLMCGVQRRGDQRASFAASALLSFAKTALRVRLLCCAHWVTPGPSGRDPVPMVPWRPSKACTQD
jgi:hypothetical protein